MKKINNTDSEIEKDNEIPQRIVRAVAAAMKELASSSYDCKLTLKVNGWVVKAKQTKADDYGPAELTVEGRHKTYVTCKCELPNN